MNDKNVLVTFETLVPGNEDVLALIIVPLCPNRFSIFPVTTIIITTIILLIIGFDIVHLFQCFGKAFEMTQTLSKALHSHLRPTVHFKKFNAKKTGPTLRQSYSLWTAKSNKIKSINYCTSSRGLKAGTIHHANQIKKIARNKYCTWKTRLNTGVE